MLSPGISSLSTPEAVSIAKSAEGVGCHGLMVLPPYVYLGDWRETKAHVTAVFSATKLSSMLYNNPIAYQTDFLPEQVQELMSEIPNLHAIKESSADVRRVTALRALVGDKLQILCGVDDVAVEAVYAGAVGWIAGLVNAFPKESVELFDLASRGEKAGGLRVVSLVPSATAHGYRAEIRSIDQAGSRGSWNGQPARPPSAAHVSRRRAQGG